MPNGRLAFFLPTVTEEYADIDIPVVEGMRELKIGDGSVQDFGKWGRRVRCSAERTEVELIEGVWAADHDGKDCGG